MLCPVVATSEVSAEQAVSMERSDTTGRGERSGAALERAMKIEEVLL